MKIGRLTLSGASVALLVFQLLVVPSIAGKYLYQRWRCPRVVDARRRLRSGDAHARPLPEPATHRRRLPKHAAFGQSCHLPARRERRHQARTVCLRAHRSPSIFAPT